MLFLIPADREFGASLRAMGEHMQGIAVKIRQYPLAAILLAGLVIRLVLAPLVHGYGYDMNVLANWSWHLRHTPLDEFYAYAESPDHLPGDLWFLWVAARLFTLFGGTNFESGAMEFLIKLVPAVADVVITILLYSLVLHFRDKAAATRTAALFLLNPAIIFLTAIWGQWDAVSFSLLLGGFWIILRFPHWWLAAIPFLAWAMVIKPPMALLVALVLVIPVWQSLRQTGSVRETVRRMAIPVAAAGVLAVGTVILLIRPFSIGLPGMDTTWRLTDRLNVALEMYKFRSMAAANIWMLGQGALDRRPDDDVVFAGLTWHSIGNGLMLIALALVFLMVARTVLQATSMKPERFIVLAMLAASLSFFMLPTRVHERYLFPAVVLAILLAGLSGFERESRNVAILISGTFFANLVVVFGGFRSYLPGVAGDFLYGPFPGLLALLNIGLLGLVFWRLRQTW